MSMESVMAALQPDDTPQSGVDDDQVLLARVLQCYKPHCRYLISMTMTAEGDLVRGSGVFEIPESCYIDDTGHLNSVEANICYNQMLYFAIAVAVRERIGPVFGSWSMGDFWRRQLPDVLIANFQSIFVRPIDARRFSGEFVAEHLTRRRLRPDRPPLISLRTSFRYWDSSGGRAHGTARVAIVEGGPAEVSR